MNYINYYNDYKHKIYTYFYYNLNKNQEQAEDLTSDTFLKAFEKFDSYNDKFAFSTWIYTIAKNILFDYYKKQKQHIEINEVSENVYSEFLSYEEDFWKNIDNNDKLKDFSKALEKLSPEQKEVVIMKYINDFSTKEISEKIWKKESNIRKILSRWLKRIKQIMT